MKKDFEMQAKEKVMEALRDHFKPEFLNRVDEVIVFHALKPEHIEQIVALQLEKVTARLMEKKIAITVSDAARVWLAQKGYDEKYGARPLKRVIQNELLDPLAMKIIEGAVTEGNEVKVDVEDEKLLVIASSASRAE